jgi:hypothetical protein
MLRMWALRPAVILYLSSSSSTFCSVLLHSISMARFPTSIRNFSFWLLEIISRLIHIW